MPNLETIKREWLSNPRGDILAGIVVALALIPEAIGFSIIAGVDPRVGLYASFSIAVIISLVGGRQGMISAATAAIAVLVLPLIRDHGVDYLFAATILMGVIQVIAGFLRLNVLMQYVSRSVITGFVNALAILIFMAQLPELTGVPMLTYALVAGGLAIIYLLPYLTKAVPSPLVAIIVLTALVYYTGFDVRTVGDMGELPSSLPAWLIPNVPFTLETLQIILPYSLTMAAVGLLESMMTAQIVDDLTDTPSDKQREMKGQGIANFFTGFLGVILSGLFFASKVKRIFTVDSELSADGLTRRYMVSGQVFFASSESFVEAFDFKEVLDRVIIDVSQAHFWDISAVGTLEKAILKFRREGTEVEVVGLNEASASMVDRYAVHDKPGAEAQLGAH